MNHINWLFLLGVCFSGIFMTGCSTTDVSAEKEYPPPLVHIVTQTPIPSATPTATPVIPTLTATLTRYVTSTATPTNTRTSTITPTYTSTWLPTLSTLFVTPLWRDPSATPVPLGNDGLPVEHYIWGLLGHKQYFKLGCEAAATHDWAWYFGHRINEAEFQSKLPLSDNPEEGFVGHVDSIWGQTPPFAYGVHAGPVAQLLQDEYDISAVAVKGFTLERLKRQIAADQPVIVWVIGNMVGGIPHEYTAKDGKKVIVAAYEHVVIITGYNKTHIRYQNNGKFFDTPVEVFLNSWKVLGNMALIAGE